MRSNRPLSGHRIWAVVRHDLRILRSDPLYLIIFVTMPLLVMGFLKPAFRGTLVLSGIKDANGAEQAVPGITVLFAFFLVSNVGFGVFREYGWATWERVRASPSSAIEVMAGKVVVPLLSLALQLTILFGIGGLLFSLRVRGSYFGIVLVGGALAMALVGLGLMLLAVCRTVMQLSAVSNLGAVLFAGLGGAVAPISSLPRWAAVIAPATPSYWAMRGFRSVIIDGQGVGAVALPTGVLLGFAVVFVGVAATRFRYDETKVSWA
jgi:ABC-2 type transport system permease protein